jgi:hypothetical protein
VACVLSPSPSVLALILTYTKRVKIAKKMIASDIFCNTLFYETLSKLKNGCFGLRIKAVFVFL